MTRTRLTLLALALAGCNPNDFGGTMDRAPVQLIERPDGFGHNAGRVLLPLSPPADNPKAAARLLFAGTEYPSLAVADFDGDGKPSVTTVDEDDLIGIGVTAGISSMAWLSSGTLALGMPELQSTTSDSAPTGSVAFVRLARNEEGKLAFSTAARSMEGQMVLGGHFGMAVARGNVTQASTEEVVAVADRGVSVLSPGGLIVASSTCTGVLNAPDDLYRSLVVADLLKGGLAEIAVGLPLLGGVGRVAILQYGPNPAKGTAEPELFCASVLQAPDSGTQAMAGFGASLEVVPDMDGDGLTELLVGAPPDRVYLFFSGGAAPKVFKKGDTFSEFGQRLTVMDIDRDGVLEVGISALQASAGKTAKAGAVFFYKLTGDGVSPQAELHDSNAEANKEFFGIGLTHMPFDSTRACGKGAPTVVPVVGADKGVFTFFRFTNGAADPRCFAL